MDSASAADVHEMPIPLALRPFGPQSMSHFRRVVGMGNGSKPQAPRAPQGPGKATFGAEPPLRRIDWQLVVLECEFVCCAEHGSEPVSHPGHDDFRRPSRGLSNSPAIGLPDQPRYARHHRVGLRQQSSPRQRSDAARSTSWPASSRDLEKLR
jgi:hypothetical protein